MGLFDDWEAKQAGKPPTASRAPWQAPPSPFGNTQAARPPAVDATGTEDEREAFVIGMLRNSREPHKLALELFGSARWQFASLVAAQWPSSDWFLRRKRELLEEHGEEAFLPTKAQIARELYNGAHDNVYDAEVSLKFLKLYCDVMEYIKPGAGASVNIQNNTQNVMVVRDGGSDAEWEEKTAAQQAKLVSGA